MKRQLKCFRFADRILSPSEDSARIPPENNRLPKKCKKKLAVEQAENHTPRVTTWPRARELSPGAKHEICSSIVCVCTYFLKEFYAPIVDANLQKKNSYVVGCCFWCELRVAGRNSAVGYFSGRRTPHLALYPTCSGRHHRSIFGP